MFFEKIRLQEPTWAKVRPTWAPKRAQSGAQKGAKTEPKRRREREGKRREVRGAWSNFARPPLVRTFYKVPIRTL